MGTEKEVIIQETNTLDSFELEDNTFFSKKDFIKHLEEKEIIEYRMYNLVCEKRIISEKEINNMYKNGRFSFYDNLTKEELKKIYNKTISYNHEDCAVKHKNK